MGLLDKGLSWFTRPSPSTAANAGTGIAGLGKAAIGGAAATGGLAIGATTGVAIDQSFNDGRATNALVDAGGALAEGIGNINRQFGLVASDDEIAKATDEANIAIFKLQQEETIKANAKTQEAYLLAQVELQKQSQIELIERSGSLFNFYEIAASVLDAIAGFVGDKGGFLTEMANGFRAKAEAMSTTLSTAEYKVDQIDGVDVGSSSGVLYPSARDPASLMSGAQPKVGDAVETSTNGEEQPSANTGNKLGFFDTTTNSWGMGQIGLDGAYNGAISGTSALLGAPVSATNYLLDTIGVYSLLGTEAPQEPTGGIDWVKGQLTDAYSWYKGFTGVTPPEATTGVEQLVYGTGNLAGQLAVGGAVAKTASVAGGLSANASAKAGFAASSADDVASTTHGVTVRTNPGNSSYAFPEAAAAATPAM